MACWHLACTTYSQNWHVIIRAFTMYSQDSCTPHYPHSPSLSRMSTAVISLPGTNEAGAVTLPEITKLSVPSTKESSMILTEALWVLSVVAPWSNVTSWLSRWKSSPSWESNNTYVNLWSSLIKFPKQFLISDQNSVKLALLGELHGMVFTFTLTCQVSLDNAKTFMAFPTVVLVIHSGLIRSMLCTKQCIYVDKYIQWVYYLANNYLCYCCFLRRYLGINPVQIAHLAVVNFFNA